MAKICITGFYGYGNAGDEGVLLAIMDSLGENKYVVCTTLPFNMLENYQALFPKGTVEVRQIYDVRNDYDAFILGGGALGWGYGWHQAITAFASEKPSMYYGVGLNWHQRYHSKLNNFYSSFLELFNAVTVRDQCSQKIAENIQAYSDNLRKKSVTLTSCPSINLKEEKFNCPKNMIAVCPRYEDYVSNDKQLQWLTERLKDVSDEVLLIPFAPYNLEGIPVDLDLCLQLKKTLKNSQLLPLVHNPRLIKYAISQSKLVITGGRYHPIVWASAHNIPFEVCPTSNNYPKVWAFEQMHAEFGGKKLKEMEKQNKKIFEEVMKNEQNT